MRRQKIAIFWIFFLFLFGSCVLTPYEEGILIQERLETDVRYAERSVYEFLGFAHSPFPPVMVEYRPYLRSSQLTDGKIVSINESTYEHGYKRRPYYFDRPFGGQKRTFSGKIEYKDVMFHEAAHYFFAKMTGWNPRDPEKWPYDTCEKGYAIASEGFAEYVSHELLVREAKKTGDSEYEEYTAVFVAYYLSWLNWEEKGIKTYRLSDLGISLPLSEESRSFINQTIETFLKNKHEEPCVDEDETGECVFKKYAIGWNWLYKWKKQFPNGKIDDGTFQKLICTYSRGYN